MRTCFVIQPYVERRFELRFEEVFKPAIEDAGLEVYRADKVPGVELPVKIIESGIRDSVVCLADITTDNPNVWYEVGYAIASGKDVVLVCAYEREKFPFDVQHRPIMRYRTEGIGDFNALRENITLTLQAVLEKQRKLQEAAAASSPLKETEGLSPIEVTALVTVLEKAQLPDVYLYMSDVLEAMVAAGFTKEAATVSLHGLNRKQMLGLSYSLTQYPTCCITQGGIDWLINNDDVLKTTSS